MVIDQIVDFFNELTQVIAQSPEFQAFGLFILFLWTIIPSVKSIVPEFFALPLLLSGMSPAVLIMVSATGATIGDFVLYLLGRGTHRLFKGKKDLARADHLLHKYRLPIFLATPFLSVFGDIIVYVAGFERIGFMKILPFIFVGQFFRMTVGMLVLLGILQLPEFFGI